MLQRLTTSSLFLMQLLVFFVFTSGVAEANNAPTPVGTIADQALKVGGAAGTVDVSANFNDADNDTLTWMVFYSFATVSVSSATVTITPVAAGTATITVTATDPDGETAEQTFSVTVTQNRAPVVDQTISDIEILNSFTTEVYAHDYFSDPDGDTLTYTASSSDSSIANIGIGVTANTTVYILANALGEVTGTVTVTDPDGATATQTFTVTVVPDNDAPVPVGTIPAQTVKVGGTAATVDVSSNFSDPDGNPLTYTAASDDTTIATVSVSDTTVTITAVAVGTATITVTAKDFYAETATQSISITVTENRAPTAVGTMPDETLILSGAAEYDPRPYFSDPDGDALTYTATSSNTASSSIILLQPTFIAVQKALGTATITVTASRPRRGDRRTDLFHNGVGKPGTNCRGDDSSTSRSCQRRHCVGFRAGLLQRA